jgi:hypothetical protein
MSAYETFGLNILKPVRAHHKVGRRTSAHNEMIFFEQKNSFQKVTVDFSRFQEVGDCRALVKRINLTTEHQIISF